MLMRSAFFSSELSHGRNDGHPPFPTLNLSVLFKVPLGNAVKKKNTRLKCLKLTLTDFRGKLFRGYYQYYTSAKGAAWPHVSFQDSKLYILILSSDRDFALRSLLSWQRCAHSNGTIVTGFSVWWIDAIGRSLSLWCWLRSWLRYYRRIECRLSR